jgi:chemotaxis signal transduction protein
MSAVAEAPIQSFVVLPLGSRRIALPAESVIELVSPTKVQSFPHRTRWISGVLVRRNHVVPVCDPKQLFGEERAGTSRFYLIAEWKEGNARDWCAIPVCGECELESAELLCSKSSAGGDAKHVSGVIPVDGEDIEVIDLSKLIRAQKQNGNAVPGRTQ